MDTIQIRGARTHNLKNVDLSNLDLRTVDFSEADLRGIDLRSSDLQGASLFKADLRNALLSEANLTGAYLSSAYMKGTDLQWSTLNQAVLRYCVNLIPAQIQSAKIDRETKVPDYLKIHWVSETDFRCEKKTG